MSGDQSTAAGERLVCNIVARMSHDVNAPINSILSLVDLVLDSQPTDEQQIDLGEIRKSARTLRTMVRGLCDLAKSQVGALAPGSYRLNIKTIFTSLEKDFQDGGADAPKAIDATIAPGLPEKMNSDPFKVQQILWNLVEVAQGLKTDTGPIHLKVEPDTETTRPGLRFSVSTTGILTGEQQTMIHTALNRPSDLLQEKNPWHALAIHSAEVLVKCLGGKLWFEKGVFYFTVPLTTPTAS